MKKYKTDLEAWKKKQGAASKGPQSAAKGKSKAQKKTTGVDDKPTRPKKPVPRMQKDEPYNFLRFATALKIFLGSSVQKNMIPRAAGLLQDYLCGFQKVSSVVSVCIYILI